MKFIGRSILEYMLKEKKFREYLTTEPVTNRHPRVYGFYPCHK